MDSYPNPGNLSPDSDKGVTDLTARGEIPSLIHPPTGCRFHPRCPHAMPVCSQRFLARTELGGGRWTNCFLFGDGEKLAEKNDNSVSHLYWYTPTNW